MTDLPIIAWNATARSPPARDFTTSMWLTIRARSIRLPEAPKHRSSSAAPPRRNISLISGNNLWQETCASPNLKGRWYEEQTACPDYTWSVRYNGFLGSNPACRPGKSPDLPCNSYRAHRQSSGLSISRRAHVD